MRASISAAALFATSAIALTNITLINTSGETRNMILGDTTSWFNIEGIYGQIDKVSVKSDTSEVVACYMSSNSLTKSQWVLYSPFREMTEWEGSEIKFVYCQEHWDLPEWVGKDAIVSD